MTDAVATITLNRPDGMNSLTVEMKEALRATVVRAAADPAVRAVILTGAGRAFCAGQDLREHGDNLAAAAAWTTPSASTTTRSSWRSRACGSRSWRP
ncbi:enoyl-CoA hydratase/isomerase family protein [Actinomadura luteofluorescens]|uniref:enoyl-CoA hydratase/isomerase family protein n=1 Tax=Actinomadura luteofluorescens TaxID=46163 RepID=UPI00364413C2